MGPSGQETKKGDFYLNKRVARRNGKNSEYERNKRKEEFQAKLELKKKLGIENPFLVRQRQIVEARVKLLQSAQVLREKRKLEKQLQRLASRQEEEQRIWRHEYWDSEEFSWYQEEYAREYVEDYWIEGYFEHSVVEQPSSSTTSNNNHSDLITSFTEITSSSIEEATFFLESHGFNLDIALSTFFETTALNANPNLNAIVTSPASSSPSRSRSVSPPPSFEIGVLATGVGDGVYSLRSRNTGAGSGSGRNTSAGRIRMFADLYKKGFEDCGSGSDEDEDKPQEYYTGGQRSDEEDGDKPQEYYTGGHRSGQLVQDPSMHNDVESLFEQARQAAAEDGTLDQHQPSSSSRSFSGRGRLLSGERPSAAPAAAPQQQPEPEAQTITFWTNGFTVNDGPLRRLDDPQNASFLESIRRSECPQELAPAKGRTPGSSSANDTTATIPAPTFAPPTPYVGLVVDDTLPSTYIQLRLGDGTRMVSRFNLHHTVGNIRSFIDASRAGGPRAYQLLTMGFPPKQLNDLNQTIQDAGLANSVVIQKL